MTKRTNEQWLAQLSGDGPEREEALAHLRQLLVKGLHRGLLGQVDTAAPEFDSLAEDFVQEALLRILDKLDTFAGRSQFTTWAHKIAVHVALTELRRKRWQDTSLNALTDKDEGEYTPSIVADPAPEPEHAAERAEMLAYVGRLIAEELTERQRQALTAAVLHGLSTGEVAELMDMKPNAVYKLLHDARMRLKQALARAGLTTTEILAVFR